MEGDGGPVGPVGPPPGQEQVSAVYLAMMEELGPQRKDTLPLSDRGALPEVKPTSKPHRKKNSANPWQNFKPDDIDPAEEKLNSFEDGLLARHRREAALANASEHKHTARGGQALSRGRGGTASRGGHSFASGRGGHGQVGNSPSRGGGHMGRGEAYMGRRRDVFSDDNSFMNPAPPPNPTSFYDGRRGVNHSSQIKATISRLRGQGLPTKQHQPAEIPSKQSNTSTARPQRAVGPTPRPVSQLASPADFFSHVGGFNTPSKPEPGSVSEDIPFQNAASVNSAVQPSTSNAVIQSPLYIVTNIDDHLKPPGQSGVGFPSLELPAASRPSTVAEPVKVLLPHMAHLPPRPVSQPDPQPTLQPNSEVSTSAGVPRVQISPDIRQDLIPPKEEAGLASSKWATYEKSSTLEPADFASGPPCVIKEHDVKVHRGRSVARTAKARLFKFGHSNYLTLQVVVDSSNWINEHVTEKATWIRDGSMITFQARSSNDTAEYPIFKIWFQMSFLAAGFENCVAETFKSSPLTDRKDASTLSLPADDNGEQIQFGASISQGESPLRNPQPTSSTLSSSEIIRPLQDSVNPAMSEFLLEDQPVLDELVKFDDSSRTQGAGYYNPNTRLSSQSFTDMAEIGGVAPLIDFSEEDAVSSEVPKLPAKYMNLIESEDRWLLEACLLYFDQESQGSFLDQISALVMGYGGPAIATLSNEEFLLSPLVFRATTRLMSVYLTSSESFGKLPDFVIAAVVIDKSKKLLKLVVGSKFRGDSPGMTLKHGSMEAALVDSKLNNMPTNSQDQDNSQATDQPADHAQYGLQGSIYATSGYPNTRYNASTAKEADSIKAGPATHTCITYSIDRLLALRQDASEFNHECLSRDVAHLARPAPVYKANHQRMRSMVGCQACAKVAPNASIGSSQISTPINSPILIKSEAEQSKEINPLLHNVFYISPIDGIVMLDPVREAAKTVQPEPSTPAQLSETLNPFNSKDQDVVDLKSSMNSQAPVIKGNGEGLKDIKSKSSLGLGNNHTNVTNRAQWITGGRGHLPTNSDCDRLAKSLQDLDLRDNSYGQQRLSENSNPQTRSAEQPSMSSPRKVRGPATYNAFLDSIKDHITKPAITTHSKLKVTVTQTPPRLQPVGRQCHPDIAGLSDEDSSKLIDFSEPKLADEEHQSPSIPESMVVKNTPTVSKVAGKSFGVSEDNTPKVPEESGLNSSVLAASGSRPSIPVLAVSQKVVNPAAVDVNSSTPGQAVTSTPSARYLEKLNNKNLKGTPGLSASMWSGVSTTPPRFPPRPWQLPPSFSPARPSPKHANSENHMLQNLSAVISPSHMYSETPMNTTYQYTNTGFATPMPSLATVLVPGPDGQLVSVTGVKVDTESVSHSWASSALTPLASPPLAPIHNLPYGFNRHKSNDSSTFGSDMLYAANSTARTPLKGTAPTSPVRDGEDPKRVEEKVRSRLRNSLAGREDPFSE